MQTTARLIVLIIVAAIGQQAAAQSRPANASTVVTGLTVRAVTVNAPGNTLSDPMSASWLQIVPQRLGLNRTPPVYDTDPPSEPEIPLVEVRLVRAERRLLVHLTWKDATENTAGLAPLPATPPETRNFKEHTQSTDRFFDAAAVMFPTNPSDGISPSLQMGDAKDSVTIYYWNPARGSLMMQAQGRGTTQRTGQTFPARAAYHAGSWNVVLELPQISTGQPLAFAIWNGSQGDRDGRKYFSVWHILEYR